MNAISFLCNFNSASWHFCFFLSVTFSTPLADETATSECIKNCWNFFIWVEWQIVLVRCFAVQFLSCVVELVRGETEISFWKHCNQPFFLIFTLGECTRVIHLSSASLASVARFFRFFALRFTWETMSSATETNTNSRSFFGPPHPSLAFISLQRYTRGNLVDLFAFHRERVGTLNVQNYVKCCFTRKRQKKWSVQDFLVFPRISLHQSETVPRCLAHSCVLADSLSWNLVCSTVMMMRESCVSSHIERSVLTHSSPKLWRESGMKKQECFVVFEDTCWNLRPAWDGKGVEMST